MDKFEYVEVLVPKGVIALDDWLNIQGQDGWEAIHFYRLDVNVAVMFKRKITA